MDTVGCFDVLDTFYCGYAKDSDDCGFVDC